MLLLLCCSVLSAQTNTASIGGQVLDPQHRPVANAEVTLVNTDLNLRRGVVADGSGHYLAAGLPPGAYTVEARLAGLKTARAVRVTLGLGSTVRVDLALAIPAVRDKTTVTARGPTSEGNTLVPPVNREEASSSSFMTGNTVTYLPNRDRDVRQFTELAGGAVEDASGNGLIIAGQRASAVITQVDGAGFNDPLHGGVRGASDGGFLLPQTVVREFQVVRSGVTTEVAGTNAGLINVATKEGSNKLRAEAFYTVRPTWATSADAFGNKLDNRQNTFGFSFGDAVKKDRIFYYAGFEQDLLQTPFATEFAPQAPGASPPVASVAALQGQVVRRSTPTALWFRGDATANAANTFNLELGGNRVSGSNTNPDASSRSLASQSHADHLSGQSLWSKLGLTTLFGQRIVNQALLAYSGDHRNLTPNSSAPEIQINGFGVLGGDALGRRLYTAQQMQAGDTLTFVRGRASFVTGMHFEDDPAYEQQEANGNGRFDFNSLAAYQSLQLRRFQQTFVVGDTRYQGSVRMLGVFAQGRIPLGRQVTLTAGLRWDAQFNPQLTPVPDDLRQVQPRLGIAYSPFAHTTVRVSSGLYDAPTPATIFHRLYADSGARTITADSYFDGQIALLAGQTLSAFSAPPALTVAHALTFGIAPQFHNPRSLQSAASVEQELHSGYSVSAGVLRSETWQLERRLDTNLFPPVTNAAGLPVFPAVRPNPTRWPCADRRIRCTRKLCGASARLNQPDRAALQPERELHVVSDAR